MSGGFDVCYFETQVNCNINHAFIYNNSTNKCQNINVCSVYKMLILSWNRKSDIRHIIVPAEFTKSFYNVVQYKIILIVYTTNEAIKSCQLTYIPSHQQWRSVINNTELALCYAHDQTFLNTTDSVIK